MICNNYFLENYHLLKSINEDEDIKMHVYKNCYIEELAIELTKKHFNKNLKNISILENSEQFQYFKNIKCDEIIKNEDNIKEFEKKIVGLLKYFEDKFMHLFDENKLLNNEYIKKTFSDYKIHNLSFEDWYKISKIHVFYKKRTPPKSVWNKYSTAFQFLISTLSINLNINEENL